MIQQFHFWKYTGRKQNHYVEERRAPPCSQHRVQQPRQGNNLSVHPWMNEWVKWRWYIYAMQYYSSIKKEGNPAICNNMDGT